MGVHKVNKVFIFALKSIEQEVLGAIQSLGTVHLESADEMLEELAGGGEEPTGASDAGRRLNTVESAIGALSPYAEKVPLLVRLRTERRRFRIDELRRQGWGVVSETEVSGSRHIVTLEIDHDSLHRGQQT